ncbi:MAG TPA: hypothetical protein VK886_16395 [Vicinamibacterales bacterium]|nr:hypothetical protein [Vicinamibacterales bacterium]
MRELVIATLILVGTTAGSAPRRAGAQAGPAQEVREVTTWYFYTVKWGYQDEFLDLFQRNHYPVLKARMQAGAYSSIRTFTPSYHGDGRADWTFAVELVAREGAPNVPSEEEVVKKLYPDVAKFRREEQRRFEILEAHWDVPLTRVDMETRALRSR